MLTMKLCILFSLFVQLVFTASQRVDSRDYKNYDVAQQMLKENTCPYLVLPDIRLPILHWQCGFPFGLRTGNRYEYDCCPGYERSSLIDNKCVLLEPTWKPIVTYLHERGHVETAKLFKSNTALPDLLNSESKQAYTVFVPQNDTDVQSPEALYLREMNAGRILVTPGRRYLHDLRNGETIVNANSIKAKFTKYSNGLAFLDCRRFVSVDQDTTNGVVHFLDGVLPHTQRYPTVLSRLRADPQLSEFVRALPADVRTALSQRDSHYWYTVFAPVNRAWQEATSLLGSTEAIDALVRHHVVKKLICSEAVTQTSSEIGPTLGNSNIRMTRRADGSKAVLDACGQEIRLLQPDLMAVTGAVHTIERTMVAMEAMDLAQALQCLQLSNNFEAKQAAKEMFACSLQTNANSKTVVLLPDQSAFKWLQSSPEQREMANRMSNDQSYRCKVYANHLLSPINPGAGRNGYLQEELFKTKYAAPDGSPTYAIANYMKERDGSRINFNGAVTTKLKPIKFRNGYIYIVNRFNKPPEKNMMQLIREEGNTKKIEEKMKESGILNDLSKHSPIVLFLAPIDMGWSTRHVENAYGSAQMRKLLQLHTIPHAVFGGHNGWLWDKTVQTLDTLLTDGSGENVKILIKRKPDGNIFVGHADLPENLWAMVIKSNKIGTDGVVWFIDWPVKCPEHIC